MHHKMQKFTNARPDTSKVQKILNSTPDAAAGLGGGGPQKKLEGVGGGNSTKNNLVLAISRI
jgi:hypothetical protein